MNFYALNGSALNGWATLYAGGASTPDITATGLAAGAVVLADGEAELDLSASALSLLAKLATGALLLDLTATHGLPNPMPLPGAIHAARGRLLVPPRAAALLVPAEPVTRVTRERLPRVGRTKETV